MHIGELLLERAVCLLGRIDRKTALLHRAHAVARAVDDVVHFAVIRIRDSIFFKAFRRRLADYSGVDLRCPAINHQHGGGLADHFVGNGCAAKRVFIRRNPAEQRRDAARLGAQDGIAAFYNTRLMTVF